MTRDGVLGLGGVLAFLAFFWVADRLVGGARRRGREPVPGGDGASGG